ncbi:MAG: dihydropteroate synthase [Deltaproteobacteria bacterium]|nr:dihydropteroate synthase [Deltaproteobacteria bacterium]
MGFTLTWGDHVLKLDQRTHIMGIVNVTPDSFSDGGQYFDQDRAIEHGLQMAREGADMIDVGGESTRPYAQKISMSQEMDRVIPVIEALGKELTIPISIDTYKGEVARKALEAGASLINDISALRFDPLMASVAAHAKVPLVLMHMKGSPHNMQNNPVYEDLVTEIMDFLKEAVKRAVKAGIREELLIVDPGIGFGKSFDDNLKIIHELGRLESLGRPVLLGSSNKAFIGHVLAKEPHERDTGTMATLAAGVMKGAHIVRVHNVGKAFETVKMIDAIMMGRASGD